jgi:prophage regulatory protein
MEHSQFGKSELPRFMKQPEVSKATGRSRSAMVRDIKSGRFPRPVKLGERAVAWRESDIAAWMNSRTVAE